MADIPLSHAPHTGCRRAGWLTHAAHTGGRGTGRWWLVALPLLCLWSPPVNAQEHAGEVRSENGRPWADGVSAAQQEQARWHFARGNAFLEREQYAKALAHYRKGLAGWDHPALHYNSMLCLINLDQPIEAYEHLERAVVFGAAPLGRELLEQAGIYRKLLEAQISQLELTCSQPGVSVTLDGKAVIDCPGRATLVTRPGTRQLVASKRGYVTLSQRITLEPKGRHHRELRLDPVQPTVVLRRRWSTWKPWALLAAGGALTLAVALPLYFKAKAGLRAYDDGITEECSPEGCLPTALAPEIGDLLPRARRYRTAAFAMFGVGATVAAAGVAMLILNLPRPVQEGGSERASRVMLAPALGPAGWGAQATIGF
jgi:tetratricopeptide (TPR) repeat protein